MAKKNIERKVLYLIDRYKHLTRNSTAKIKRCQLEKMSVEVGQLFDILSCKK